MVGRELTEQRPRCAPQTGTEVLRVENLTRSGAFEDVSLTLHAGEIVGPRGTRGVGTDGAVEGDFRRATLRERTHLLEPASRFELIRRATPCPGGLRIWPRIVTRRV